MPSCYHSNTLIRDFAILPAVDVLDGKAVRLLRGDFDRVEVDAGDPLELVRRAAASRPPLVHVVALAAARDGGAPVELAAAAVAAAAPVPVQLGGGVRSPADAEALVAAGVARVVVGTAAFGETPLRAFVDAVGDRLAVAIDVAGGDRAHGGLARVVRADDGARRSRAAPMRASPPSSAPRSTATAPAAAPTSSCCARCAAASPAACSPQAASATPPTCRPCATLGLDGVVVGRAWLDGTYVL